MFNIDLANVPFVLSNNARKVLRAVFVKPQEQFEYMCSLKIQEDRVKLKPAVISSHTRFSGAVNLSIYSSSNVMNSMLTNKGSGGSSWTTIIPSMGVCYCKSTYPQLTAKN